jgi:TonB-linked outer membrane protein, SusC/RagA family
MSKLYLFISLLFIPLFTFAAIGHRITGRVLDESGSPLVGVTIRVKEVLNVGTTTNTDGAFSLNVPEKGKNLLFTYIGMEDQTVSISSKTSNLIIRMKATDYQIDQVVVTGYRQTTFKKMTGSVGVVLGDVLNNKPQSDIDALLQGQIAGVAVSAQDGQPGRAQKIRIRGTSTISGFSEPLWVVDGVPLQNSTPGLPSTSEINSGSFDNLFMDGVAGINPNDIETITVLKDASAAAIYGSRASNGVIVVTTKKGKAGKMHINYGANLSIIFSPQRDAGLMNASEKIAYEKGLWDEFSADGYKNGTKFPIIGIVGMVRSGKKDYQGWSASQQEAYLDQLSKNNTNWYDELFRNAISTNHHLSLSGGSDKYTYYVGMGYTRDGGLLKNNNSDRYNFNTNLSMQPSSRVKLDFGINFSYLNSKAPFTGSVDPFNYAYFANPYETPYNNDGSYRKDETYYSEGIYNNSSTSWPSVPSCGFNMLRELNETSSRNKRVDATLRGGLEYQFTNQLKFVGLASYSYGNNKTTDLMGAQTLSAFRNRLSVDSKSNKEYGVIRQTATDMDSYLLRGHFVYNLDFGNKNSLSILAGAELRGTKSKGLYSKRYGYDPITENNTTPLPSNSSQVGYDLLKQYLSALDASSGQTADEQRYAAFYASVDYYLLNKYIFNLSFRTDGSSNFGSDKQFNPNGAAGAAWVISEENFMKSLKPTLDRLTLRLSGGYTGNINRSVYPQLVISYYDDYRNVNNNIYHIGRVAGAPNPNLRWEKTYDLKAALDFGLFKDRLSGLFEMYYRKSSDVVVNSRVLSTTGYTSQKYNMADILNKGIELTLNGTPIKTRDFSLDLSANLAWNNNKVVKYKPTYKSMSLGDLWEGYPVDAIYSGKLSGIDPETGLYTFELRSDAVINKATDLNKPDNYRFYLGTGQAPYTGGFNVKLAYKGVRVSVNGVYSINAKDFDYINPPASYSASSGTVVESTQTFRNDLYAMHLNAPKTAIDRWTKTNTAGSYPRVWNVYGTRYNFGYYNPMSAEITRGAFLVDLTYVRIKNIVFGYEFSNKLLRKTPLSKLNVACSLNNFFTFTGYKGMDPETPGATYPVSRSVTFTLNAEF